LPPACNGRLLPVFRFRLYLPDGSDVAVFDTLVPNWQPGET
jgi:hypothetical protein